MTLPRPEFPLTVFYDGACSICSLEIEHYRSHDRLQRLLPLDISAAGFDASPYGIPLEEFMERLHAIDQRGSVYRGVDAFWAIWQAFPPDSIYGFMGRVIRLPGVNGLARLGYRVFARIRKYLPKRVPVCDGGSCRIGRH